MSFVRSRPLLGFVALALVAIAVSSAMFMQRSDSDGKASARAVIVDQLALTDPNQEFVDHAESLLRDAGYQVDYLPSEDVTVDFYRQLATRGYTFIVLRSHTSEQSYSVDQATHEVTAEKHVRLFTNEPYSTQKYVQEQLDSKLTIGTYPQDEALGRFFSIDPAFVTGSMHGRFRDATIVLMGCGGLNTRDMGDALISRGAKQLVGWDKAVSAEHTDEATTRLLEHMLREGEAPSQAVAQTMDEVGADPTYGARLHLYAAASS